MTIVHHHLTLTLRVGATVAMAGLWLGASAPVLYAQGPLPAPIESRTTVENHITLSVPDMDPVVVREASGEAAGGVFNTVIAPPPIQWATELLGLPNVWTQTPDDLTWNNGAIRTLSELIRNIALSLLVLALIVIGVQIAMAHDDASALKRPVCAVLMVLGTLLWWEMGIRLNNAINSVISAPALPSLIRPHLTTTIDPAAAVGTVAVMVVYAITAILLMFSQLFRLGLVDILIAIGGLALICYATEQTEYIARHYIRISVAVCFAQVIISVCLVCASVLTSLGSAGVLGSLIGIAILWLARSAPQAILAGSSNGQQPGNRLGANVLSVIRRRFSR